MEEKSVWRRLGRVVVFNISIGFRNKDITAVRLGQAQNP